MRWEIPALHIPAPQKPRALPRVRDTGLWSWRGAAPLGGLSCWVGSVVGSGVQAGAEFHPSGGGQGLFHTCYLGLRKTGLKT